MFSNMITIPFRVRYVNQASYITNRLISRKAYVKQNVSNTLLQQYIRREQNYVLPYLYLLQSPGKLITSKFVIAFNKWLEIPDDKIHQITDISQTLHHATLLIDDIIDKATMRRDIPAANTIFSLGNTLTAANFVYFLVISAARQLGHPDAPHVIVEQLVDCHRGQAMELYWSENLHIPTLEEYDLCILNKSTAAYWVPIKLMQLFSKKKYDFNSFMTVFSKYFQIRDDYNDLIGLDPLSLSDDIATGRYSYLIIHAFRNHPEDYQIKRILQLETRDHNIKKHLVSLLEKYGTFEHTRVLLQKLEKETRDEIRKLGGNPTLEEIVDYLSSTGYYNN